MTPDQITAELDRLHRLVSARDGKAGFRANVVAIRSRIAELEKMTAE